MKRFVKGLVLGIIVGSLGTAGTFIVLRKRASREPEPVEARLPDSPKGSAAELTEFLEEHPYEVGFFARNLNTGETIGRSEQRSVCLASIVKLFCLTELYRQKHDKALDLSQKIEVPKRGSISLSQAADLMIGRSDNAATQALADFLGRDNVNRIPSLLGLDSMGADILPDEETFRQTLDKRIFGDRVAKAGLPQHGTAKGMAGYFDLLINKKVISADVSTDLTNFLLEHPKPFSTHFAGKYQFAGKGGNILWTRPPKHYSMMGWALFLKNESGGCIVLCVWGEWFPEKMPPESQSRFLKYVTDCVISIVES